jgi:hypothetical protein
MSRLRTPLGRLRFYLWMAIVINSAVAFVVAFYGPLILLVGNGASIFAAYWVLWRVREL